MNNEEIPLRPLGREEIHKLETALLIGTLLREDVIKEIRESEERLTWIDSLAVAAGALARERAGMSVSQIADDLGRSEGTIRNHLSGRTKAGRLVRETYEKIRKEGFKVTLPGELLAESTQELEKRIRELESERENLLSKYSEERSRRKELERRVNRIKEMLRDLNSRLEEILKLVE